MVKGKNRKKRQAYHAVNSLSKRIPLKKRGRSDSEMEDTINGVNVKTRKVGIEMLSFDYQYWKAQAGIRNPSQHAKSTLEGQYRRLYDDFIDRGKADSADGRLAKLIVENLRVRLE